MRAEDLTPAMDFFGNYEYVIDEFTGTPDRDSFYLGKGPAFVIGGAGRDTAYLDYRITDILSSHHSETGRAHLRVRSGNDVGEDSHPINLFGIETIVFIGGDRIRPSGPSARFRFASIHAGQYDFVSDELQGDPAGMTPDIFLPGSGDAIIGGSSKVDVLVIPQTYGETQLDFKRDGSGSALFRDANGDGSHQYLFQEIDRLEFEDLSLERRGRKGNATRFEKKTLKPLKPL